MGSEVKTLQDVIAEMEEDQKNMEKGENDEIQLIWI
jgi:hypothetical protein